MPSRRSIPREPRLTRFPQTSEDSTAFSTAPTRNSARSWKRLWEKRYPPRPYPGSRKRGKCPDNRSDDRILLATAPAPTSLRSRRARGPPGARRRGSSIWSAPSYIRLPPARLQGDRPVRHTRPHGRPPVAVEALLHVQEGYRLHVRSLGVQRLDLQPHSNGIGLLFGGLLGRPRSDAASPRGVGRGAARTHPRGLGATAAGGGGEGTPSLASIRWLIEQATKPR